jgi:hypothetical protein
MTLLTTTNKRHICDVKSINATIKVVICIVVVSLVRVLEPKCPLCNIPCSPVLGDPRDKLLTITASMQI